MQASGLTEFIPFICTSAIWGQSCFLVHLKVWQMAAACIDPAPQQSPCRGWQHPLDHSFGDLHSHLKARNRWWLWHFLFIDMAGDIFISQAHGKNPVLYVLLWDVTSPVLNLFLGTRLGCEFQHGTLADEREWIQLSLSCLNFHGPVKNLTLGNCISLFHYSFPRLLYLFIPQADIYSFLLFSHCLGGYQICMNPFFPSLCAVSSGCCYFFSLQ